MYEKVMVMAEIVWVRDLVLVLLSDDFGQINNLKLVAIPGITAPKIFKK